MIYGALEVNEADIFALVRLHPHEAVSLVARVIRAGGPGKFAAPDCKNATRHAILHELVNELAEGDADVSTHLMGHRAVVVLIAVTPDELDGAAAAFAALGRRGLLCDYAFLVARFQPRRGWLLNWDHLHSSRCGNPTAQAARLPQRRAAQQALPSWGSI